MLAGIDADYLSVIESTLNVHFQLLYFPTRSEALSALHHGDIDMLAIWRPALENNRTVAASLPWLHDQAVVIHSDQALLQQTEIENGLLALMQDKQHQWDPYGASPNSFLDYYHAVQRLATGESVRLPLIAPPPTTGTRLKLCLADAGCNLRCAELQLWE
ncbi:hypothetical protein LZ023_36550 (plasmid) [Pseudomonas silvicola]|nr:hypothetical protein LZ023_36550 [Pseudomonas silvicola]